MQGYYEKKKSVWERWEEMKFETMINTEYDVRFLKASVEVRYWEAAELNGKNVSDDNESFPCRNGDKWEPLIDMEYGIITNWIKGNTASVHFKVCDAGIYSLLDDNLKMHVKIEDYVPKMMCPAENGYGDYVIMNISEEGLIDKWSVDFSDFKDDEGDDY